MSVCVIPARGGSKRIPRKNLRLFEDVPLIGRTIRTLAKSDEIDKIIVSTDDPEIADVAVAFGASVPFYRPSRLSDDFATTKQVMCHAIDELKKIGINCEHVCCVYPTAVFLRPKDLDEALKLFRTGLWQCVMTATPFSSPVQRAFKKVSGGGIEMLFPKAYSNRSQDTETCYHDAGQFYWATQQTWQSEAPLFGPQTTFVEIPSWASCDLDTESDWIDMELKARALSERGFWQGGVPK